MQRLPMKGTARRRWVCLLLAPVVCLGGCPFVVDVGGPPTIEFTYVPPIGSFENLYGTASGALFPQHRVVVYIRVGEQWWVKPTEANPLTSVSLSGRWETDITTGGTDELATEIRAYLVPAGFAAELHGLPPDDVVLASVSTAR